SRRADGILEGGTSAPAVTFAKTNGAGTVTGLGTATASGGVATKTVTGTLAGSLTITASANPLNADTATFSVVAGAADHLTFTSSTVDLASGDTRYLAGRIGNVGGNMIRGDNATSDTYATS